LDTFLNKKRTLQSFDASHGMDFMGTAAGRHLIGHLELKEHYFTTDQKQRVKFITRGSIYVKELEPAMRKIFGDKIDESHNRNITKAYWQHITRGGMNEEDFMQEIFYGLVEFDENEEEEPNSVFFEDEIDAVMEDSDVLECWRTTFRRFLLWRSSRQGGYLQLRRNPQ
jgi:hypothetical protein